MGNCLGIFRDAAANDAVKKRLPGCLAKLPVYRFTSAPAYSRRDQQARTDIVFNIQSLDDLQVALREGFGTNIPNPGRYMTVITARERRERLQRRLD